MSKPKKITYDEMMKELDKHRGPVSRVKVLNKEQIKFLKACREHTSPVTYDIMCELWEKQGWGSISPNTIRKRYVDLQ